MAGCSGGKGRSPLVLDLAQDLDAVLLMVDMDFPNVLIYPPSEEEVLIHPLKQVLADLYREKLRRLLVIVQPEGYRIRRSLPEGD